jgi:hypothetical protein
VEKVRPRGPGIRGETWKLCQKQREFLQDKVDLGLQLTKVRKLLMRQTGEVVPYWTLHRFASEEHRRHEPAAQRRGPHRHRFLAGP